ncbi:hypothetical protein BaRGS_00031220 [Batillaria attramentaria]|uniref:Uncharacterized protein n=1 Tax=Batillaria attramentaria TaxID=370345 RepID=A0ABD0JSC8_9CAEN
MHVPTGRTHLEVCRLATRHEHGQTVGTRPVPPAPHSMTNRIVAEAQQYQMVPDIVTFASFLSTSVGVLNFVCGILRVFYRS